MNHSDDKLMTCGYNGDGDKDHVNVTMMVLVVRCRLFDGQPTSGGVNHWLMVIERFKVIKLKNWCWGWHSPRIQPFLLDAALVAFRLAKRPEKSEERRMFSKARNNSVGKISWVLFFNFDDYVGFDDGDSGGFDGGFYDRCMAS